ncbi:VOC family protein [Corynebacterium sp. L4756]|uniref:VOC family protein n=1 Tax=unclassified Corynebacterium TaxID=2624378 RepID=UPI00374D770A
MRIYIASVFVDDMDKAYDFYVNKLGFTVKDSVKNEHFWWLTVTNPDGGMELLLEPNGHPAAQAFTKAIAQDGIPATQFLSDDVEAETAALKNKGVEFTMEPTDVGPSIISVFNDTCGNLIQLVQLKN